MLYAAYGSNLHPVRMRQRTPSARLIGTAAVAGMALRFHKRGYRDFSGKCNIVRNGDRCIYVAIYEIPLSEMRWLDHHEGAGSGYNRTLVKVEGFGNCVTYQATAAAHIDDTLQPFTWYKTLVLAGCQKLAFPDSYVKAIRAVPAVQDLDSDRHETHMQLAAECVESQGETA